MTALQGLFPPSFTDLRKETQKVNRCVTVALERIGTGHYCPLGSVLFQCQFRGVPLGTDGEALGRWRKWNLSDCPVSGKFLFGLPTRFRYHHLLEAFPDYSKLLPQSILAHCASFCYEKSLDGCDQFRKVLVHKITAPS